MNFTAPPLCRILVNGQPTIFNFDHITLVQDCSDGTVTIHMGKDCFVLLTDDEQERFLRQYENYARRKAKSLDLDAGQEATTLLRDEERRLSTGNYRLECYRTSTWLGTMLTFRLGARTQETQGARGAHWQWRVRTVAMQEADPEEETGDDDAMTTRIDTYVAAACARWHRRIDREAAYAALAGENGDAA